MEMEHILMLTVLTTTEIGSTINSMVTEWSPGQMVQKYEGHYIDGKKEGKGKLTFADGSFYEGEFK